MAETEAQTGMKSLCGRDSLLAPAGEPAAAAHRFHSQSLQRAEPHNAPLHTSLALSPMELFAKNQRDTLDLDKLARRSVTADGRAE